MDLLITSLKLILLQYIDVSLSNESLLMDLLITSLKLILLQYIDD